MSPRLTGLPVVALILAASFGTAAVLALPDPDRSSATSADGRFAAHGTFSALQVERLPDRISQAGDVPAYRVTAEGSAPARAYDASLSYDPAWAAQRFHGAALALWSYDPALSVWRRAASQEDRVAGAVSAEGVPGASDWTLAPADSGPVPVAAASLLDALLSFPPDGAVGYEAFAAAAEPGSEDFFLVAEPLARGGCAGTFASGHETTVTKELRSSSGTVRVAIRFQVSAGCPPGAALAPAL